MPLHRFPSSDLPFIIQASSSYVIPAIPLKPPSRIFPVNPTFFTPDGQRLRGIDAEVIQLRIMAFMTKLGKHKPIFGKFIRAIGHVFAAEDSHFQHLLWVQFRQEFRMKVLSYGFSKIVNIICLHHVVDNDFPPAHFIPPESQACRGLRHRSAAGFSYFIVFASSTSTWFTVSRRTKP